MKKAATFFAAGLMACLLAVPAYAAGLYPISVEEYTSGPLDEPRIDKVYQLSRSDDPEGIPTGDFDRGGLHYTLLDVVKTDQSQTDAKDYAEVITLETDTKDLAQILQKLEPALDVTTEDGYTGTLTPDYPGITVEAKGYKTSTRTVTATRSYPSLSDADTALLPRTIQDGGRTLELADVQWQEAGGFYNATATVEYKGEVTRTSCDTVLYTVTFAAQGGTQLEPEPQPSQAPSEPEAPEDSGFDLRWLIILPALAALTGLAFGGRFIYKLVKSKKEWKEYTK